MPDLRLQHRDAQQGGGGHCVSWVIRENILFRLGLIFLLMLAPCAAASAQAEDTEQLIRQGRQAIEAGQAEQAGLIFERILLEQPWLLGVWLDYALTLQKIGDSDSARAIYQSLLQQNPPEHLVPWLKQQIQITSPPVADWQYAGAEWEMLAYPSISELNRQYLGIAAGLDCKQNLAWQLLLRAGLDQAENQRPGGDQQRIVLRGQLGGNLGAGKWLALTELAQLHDTGGYSPLLDNNAARNIQHGLLKLEYQHPLGSSLYALASAEAFRQHSNLPLFTLRGKAAWLGIRYLF